MRSYTSCTLRLRSYNRETGFEDHYAYEPKVRSYYYNVLRNRHRIQYYRRTFRVYYNKIESYKGDDVDRIVAIRVWYWFDPNYYGSTNWRRSSWAYYLGISIDDSLLLWNGWNPHNPFVQSNRGLYIRIRMLRCGKVESKGGERMRRVVEQRRDSKRSIFVIYVLVDHKECNYIRRSFQSMRLYLKMRVHFQHIPSSKWYFHSSFDFHKMALFLNKIKRVWFEFQKEKEWMCFYFLFSDVGFKFSDLFIF